MSNNPFNIGHLRSIRSVQHALCLAIWLLAALPFAFAQQPTAASRTTQIAVPIDTSPVLFTLSLTPEIASPLRDTLPGNSFRQYDPARRQPVDWATLGNVGSGGRPLFFETPARLGFDPGIHLFDLYQTQPEDLRFYRGARALSQVFFSQGRNQQENMVQAALSHTFSGGLCFALDFRGMRNLGQYRYQATRQNALTLGAWLPIGQRYDGFLIFNTNTHQQEENGGIVTDTVFGNGQLQGPIDAEIRLPEGRAITRHFDWTLHLTQHLKFTGGSVGKRVLRATHTVDWTQQTFKFADPGTGNVFGLGADAAFFKSPDSSLLTDLRGLRNYLGVNHLDNSFSLTTFKQKTSGRTADSFSAGLKHAVYYLDQEAYDSTFSNLFLTGNLALAPSNAFSISAKGALGLLKNTGEYQATGILTLLFGKAGELRAEALTQRRPPTLLNTRLVVTRRDVWQFDFEKVLENSLSVTYALPLIGFEATARVHQANNYIYYDRTGFPAQTSAPLQVVQFLLKENIRLGGLRLDNTVALQRDNRPEVLHLPRWFTKNSLYYSGKVFKKRLLLETGVDFRINGAFQPEAYQPLSWQFYLQDSITQEPFVWLDAFLAFKVQTFRFFIRAENVRTWIWDKKSVFYQTAHYPQPFAGLRFGVAWRFLDANRQEAPASPNGASGTTPTLGPTGRGQ